MVNEDTFESIIDPVKPLRIIRSHRMHEPSHLPIVFRALALAIIAACLCTAALPLERSAPAKPLEPHDAQTYAPITFPSPPYVEPSEPRTEATTRASRNAERQQPSKVEIVISFAMAQQGKRYVFGASGPATYDCSGLVLAAYAQIGITLYHYTGVMITKGRAVVSSDLQRGDLIFPSYNHVQIYLGNGKVLHASSGQGKVVVANLGTYIAARRLV